MARTLASGAQASARLRVGATAARMPSPQSRQKRRPPCGNRTFCCRRRACCPGWAQSSMGTMSSMRTSSTMGSDHSSSGSRWRCGWAWAHGRRSVASCTLQPLAAAGASGACGPTSVRRWRPRWRRRPPPWLACWSASPAARCTLRCPPARPAGGTPRSPCTPRCSPGDSRTCRPAAWRSWRCTAGWPAGSCAPRCPPHAPGCAVCC